MTPNTEEVYFAGGCLWGVQEFLRHVPGVLSTEAGRANGATNQRHGDYDGFAECVRTLFDPEKVSVEQLIEALFEIIDPYSLNRQGHDVGARYRTGVYSQDPSHLRRAKEWIFAGTDASRIVVEVMPLTNYVKSAAAHQDRLTRRPDDYCHIPKQLLYRYRNSASDENKR
ncbi:MAG: methionine sulfoxide reductase A [Opitutaceae bacterium BACL24 MAG-120322-bin51]|jgi:peptide-methionine (S)-S-oxide reductase|nr:MAG: methionine sulfoxide reductase A [Opitutaceae bacterium BACL24 MAG-120322-bin51]